MNARGEKEHAALVQKRDAMEERADEHDRKAAKLREQAKALLPDIAHDAPGASKQAAELEAQAQESDLSAKACRAEMHAVQAKLDEDRPAREAAAAEKRRERRDAESLRAVEAARAFDDAVCEAVASFSRFRDQLAVAVSLGHDQHVMHQMLPQYVLTPALVAAGMPDVGVGLHPKSLEAAARDYLGLRAGLEAIERHAEYLRLNKHDFDAHLAEPGVTLVPKRT